MDGSAAQVGHASMTATDPGDPAQRDLEAQLNPAQTRAAVAGSAAVALAGRAWSRRLLQ